MAKLYFGTKEQCDKIKRDDQPLKNVLKVLDPDYQEEWKEEYLTALHSLFYVLKHYDLAIAFDVHSIKKYKLVEDLLTHLVNRAYTHTEMSEECISLEVKVVRKSPKDIM